MQDNHKNTNVSEEVDRAISLIDGGDEGQLVPQLSELNKMDLLSCEPECLNRFVSTLSPMISAWSPSIQVQISKLLMNLQKHRYFSEAHAKAVLKSLFPVVLSFPGGDSEITTSNFIVFGDLIRGLLSKCSFDEIEYLDIELYSHQVLRYDIPEKRRIFAKLYLGLLDSRIDRTILERQALPRLNSMLETQGEQIIRGDVVYVVSLLMRNYPMRTRIMKIWPEIQDIWYYGLPLSGGSLDYALATFFELFRNDHELRAASESIRFALCELLISIVQFVRKKCTSLVPSMSAQDARFLKFFTASIRRLFRIVGLVGNCQLRAELFGLVHELCGCYLHDVRVAIATALPSITRMVFEVKNIECPSVAASVSPSCFGGLLQFLPVVPFTRSKITVTVAKEVVHADRFFHTLAKLMEDNEKSVRVEMLKGLGSVMKSLSDYPRSRAINARLCQALTYVMQHDRPEIRESITSQYEEISRIYSGHGTRSKRLELEYVPSCSIRSIVAAYRH